MYAVRKRKYGFFYYCKTYNTQTEGNQAWSSRTVKRRGRWWRAACRRLKSCEHFSGPIKLSPPLSLYHHDETNKQQHFVLARQGRCPANVAFTKTLIWPSTMKISVCTRRELAALCVYFHRFILVHPHGTLLPVLSRSLPLVCWGSPCSRSPLTSPEVSWGWWHAEHCDRRRWCRHSLHDFSVFRHHHMKCNHCIDYWENELARKIVVLWWKKQI